MTLPLSCMQMHTSREFEAELGDLFHNTGSEPCASNVVRMLHFRQIKGGLQKVDDDIDLLVDPVLLGGGPVTELLGLEPEGNLVVGRLNSVRAMADVAPDMDGEVSPDGSREGSGRVGFTKHNTTSLHCVQTLPNHGADRAAGHVGDKPTEESLAGEVSVVLLQVLHRGLHHLHRDQLETLLLKARDNLANKAALDAVRLDHDEGPLSGHDDSGVGISLKKCIQAV